MKIAVVSITKHGIALAGKVVAALPGAQLFCPEKFRAEGKSAAPGAVHCYEGKVGDQVPALFAAFAADSTGANWTYLPYGPFADEAAFTAWLASVAGGSGWPCFS